MNVVFEADLPVSQFEQVDRVIQMLHRIDPNAEIGVSTQAAPTTRRARQTARTNGGPATGDPPSSSAGVSANEVQTPPDAASDQAQDEGDEEFGLAATASSLSPEEAREKALGICRNVYNADHREPIRALRKQFGVTKFPDIELENAHEFLRAAEAMAQKVGMRV
jgi:hypothetical protein